MHQTPFNVFAAGEHAGKVRDRSLKLSALLSGEQRFLEELQQDPEVSSIAYYAAADALAQRLVDAKGEFPDEESKRKFKAIKLGEFGCKELALMLLNCPTGYAELVARGGPELWQ